MLTILRPFTGGGDQSAEIEKLAWEIADEALQAQIDEIKTSYRERVIGQVIHSILPLKDSGVHLLDGTALYNGGIYADFYNYVKGLKTDYPDVFIDEAEWSSCVNTYGSCGKFVLTNDYIRLPKITDIIQGTTNVSALGDLVEAGLPNITGTFDGNTDDGSTYKTGAFYNKSTTDTGANGIIGEGVVGFDASRANSIYGKSTTVQPQSIKALLYIVVATAVKTDVEVNIDNVVTDMNLLSNQLQNLQETLPEVIEANGFKYPDYSAKIDVGNVTDRVPSTNVVVYCDETSNYAVGYITIDGTTFHVSKADKNGAGNWTYRQFLIKKGTAYTTTGFHEVWEIPLID